MQTEHQCRGLDTHTQSLAYLSGALCTEKSTKYTGLLRRKKYRDNPTTIMAMQPMTVTCVCWVSVGKVNE